MGQRVFWAREFFGEDMLRKSLIITLAMTPMVLAGCSSIPFSDRFGKGKAAKETRADAAALAVKAEIPAQSLLNAGVRNINTGDYERAQKAFTELGKQHPFSKEAERSLVLSAFSHFSEGKFDKTVSQLSALSSFTQAAMMRLICSI